MERRCTPGNAMPCHSVELVKFCIECNNSPSNGNGGAKNSCTLSPFIDDGESPEDPSAGEPRPSSAWIWWIWLVLPYFAFGLAGEIDDLLGEPEANEDEFLDDGFRV